ncbi:MAG: pyridoxal 5'-phosphate synthase glutaminase subunit PdxT [Actinomycetales bacterium]|nr:pyridoxal 5'-phosphate synthase glutaminase subunit PdxT [Actinomycetales bacterium]
MLQRSGARVAQVRSAEQLGGLQGLVIPGGESTTMALLAERWGLLEPLRSAVQAGLPVYGSCAGMIMLANEILDAKAGQQVIGGLDVTVRRNAFGRQVDSFEIDLDMPVLGAQPFHAVFIRAPRVERVGPSVEILAELPGSIVAIRQDRILATAFHPELTEDDRIHALFIEMTRN